MEESGVCLGLNVNDSDEVKSGRSMRKEMPRTVVWKLIDSDRTYLYTFPTLRNEIQLYYRFDGINS